MLYTVINITLIVALAATSIFCIVMYRELRKFKAISGEYATILRETSRAVDSVEKAVSSVHEDGASTLIALGERIDAAQRTLNSLRNAEVMAAAQLARLQDKVERPQPPRRDRSREVVTPPQAHEAGGDEQAYGPGASQPKTLRVRRSFEWPIVRSDDLTPQQA
jgi:hypothetical protein